MYTAEEFEKTLRIVKEMLQNGEAFISLSPLFASTIEIDRAVIRRYFKDAPDAASKFKQQATEAGELLLPILEGNTEHYVNMKVRQKSRR